jgi:hypothetical protein
LWPFQPLNSNEALGNPFYSNSFHLSSIAFGNKSDFYPEDGWELIKQEFGFIHNPMINKWNGTPKTNTNDNPAIAYFVLYNKFSGILRILATMPNSWGGDKIQISLNFIHGDVVGVYKEKELYKDFKTSGNFNTHGKHAQSLDKHSETNTIKAIAYQPNQLSEFFYADFQLSYDPCVCLFKSGLNVNFNRINNSIILASGNTLGENEVLARIENSRSLINTNEEVYKYNTSFITEGMTVTNILQYFHNLNSFEDMIKSIDFKNEQLDLESTISEIGDLLVNNVIYSNKLKNAKRQFENITPHVDFFSVQNNMKNIRPVAISSNIDITSLHFPQSPMFEKSILISNPGSCESNNRPEYTSLDINGVIPMYPMYNEPLGLSAMLQTPKIKRTLIADKIDDCGKCKNQSSKRCNRKCNSNSSKQIRRVENLQEWYKLEGNSIKIAFHPLVDSDKTQVDAAIEVYGIDDLVVGSEKDFFLKKTTTLCSKIDDKDGIGRYRTPFSPLQCLDEWTFAIGHSYFGKKNIHNEFFTKARAHAFIVLNIYYVFKEDVYGKVHTGVQTIKYPLEIIETTVNLSSYVRFDMDELQDSICMNSPKLFIANPTEVSNFCKSDSYKAKSPAPELANQNELLDNTISSSKNIAAVYPNPNNGDFEILFQNPTIVIHTLSIFDPLGRNIYTQKLERGQQVFSVNGLNLTPGMYILSIIHACEKQTFKILIQN